MIKITSKEFKECIEKDPQWAKKLKSPTEVTDYCYLAGSPIECLSPLLKFSGTNDEGWSAVFSRCPKLEVASGTFSRAVLFEHCLNLKEVVQLKVLSPSQDGWAAAFPQCRALSLIGGEFPGAVNLYGAAISSTSRIRITAPSENGTAIILSGCKNLKEPEGHFPGLVLLTNSGTTSLARLSVSGGSREKGAEGVKIVVKDCDQLRRIPLRFAPEEVRASEELLKDLRRNLQIQMTTEKCKGDPLNLSLS